MPGTRKLPFLTILIASLIAGPTLSISRAEAGSTPWLDRDNPGGKGDYEDTVNLLRIQCRIKGTNQRVATNVPSAGYFKDRVRGCWCVNSKVPNGQCKDIEIKYSW